MITDIKEINKILTELSKWYYNNNFDNITEDEKKEQITKKVRDLEVFNIDIDKIYYTLRSVVPLLGDERESIGDLKGINVYYDEEINRTILAEGLSLDAIKIMVLFSEKIFDSITEEEKTNQLKNNKNFLSFIKGMSSDFIMQKNPTTVVEYIVDICLKNPLEFTNDEIISIVLNVLQNNYSKEKKISEIFNIIKDRDKQNLEKSIERLIDKYEEQNDSKKNKYNFFLSIINSFCDNEHADNLKAKIALNSLKYSYNDDTYNGYIGQLKDFDAKLDLCRKTIDYQQKVNEKYFRNFMLSFVFDSTIEVTSKEDAHFLISKLQEVITDEKLKTYVDPYTITSIFSAIKDDSILLSTYNEIVKIPSLSGMINSSVVKEFIKCIEDDKLKLQIINQAINKKMINIKEVEMLFLLNHIKNKSLFLDKSLTEVIYTNPEFSLRIAELASPTTFAYTTAKYFKNDEEKYIKEGRLGELLEKYKTIGFIDTATLNEIYDISSKYIKNLTMDDMIKRITGNPNVKEIIMHIATNSERDKVGFIAPDGIRKTVYQYQLEKFATIFPKTRFSSVPDFASYQKMPIDMCEKFNVKTWNQLIQNPLFNQDDNTKRALVEIIAISGLFESDPMVELRKRQIINLFNNYNLPLSKEEMDFLEISDNEWITSHFDSVNIKSYRLRDGITIPENLTNWLSQNLTSEQMTRIKKETGNTGSELTKYLSPYARTENGWILRNGIQIELYSDYLKPEMTNEEYMSLLTSTETPREIIEFLNPYEEVREQGYKLKQSLTGTDRAEVIHLLLDSNLNNRYNFENIHRMFDGFDLSYDPNFYQFFLENQDQILATPEKQSQLKEAKRKYNLFKNYFASRGNHNPNYNDMVVFLDKAPYVITFGNEEFAQDAKNTQVSSEGYTFYEKILQETRKRHLTTIPRHEKTYEYVANNGLKYQVIAKVLRADDPFNLLVGESHFTNCCQRYNNTGEPCMKHASTSQNGGIFATYLVTDGSPSMLTQSWFWTNEAKACLDNVEATSLITEASGEKKKLLQDIATFAIKSSCADMIKSSKETVDEYIKDATKKIMNSSLSEKEKREELKKLEEVRKRQTIKIITVGDGCDDLRVKESFTQIEPEENSYGPKGYEGYRDSTGDELHLQHIIIQTNEKVLTPSEEYKDIPMFRDNRQVSVESSSEIRYETLRKITDIESIAHKSQMLQYIKDGEFTIIEPEFLAKIYNCSLDDLKVISGEDWYYVYSNGRSEIEVFDLAKKDPRLPDEGMAQIGEMASAFEKILSDSIILNNDGFVESIKPIKADLREDTSYLLYLTQMKRGVIEQIGDDIAYPYSEGNKNGTITNNQEEILANAKQIKEKQNPDMIMHEVVFKPTAKEIEKLIKMKQAEIKELGGQLYA